MEIRRFNEDKDSFEELIKLFKTGLGETDIDFWNWKYLQNTGFDKQIMYVILDGEKYIAMMGFVPFEYVSPDGKVLKYAQTCDLVVLPEYRGQGLFYKIHEYAENDLTNNGYLALFGFPNDNSLHGFLKMGYKPNDIYICKPKSNLFYMIKNKLRLPTIDTKSKFDCYVEPNYCSNISQFIFNTDWLLNKYVRLNLNKDFLNWRCESYNKGKYKCIFVKQNNDVIAYFIVLVTKGSHFTASKVVCFDINKKYISDIKNIVKCVKKKIYSFSDMIDFYGIWSDEVKDIICKFGVKSRDIICAKTYTIKYLNNHNEDNLERFINHVDTDL